MVRRNPFKGTLASAFSDDSKISPQRIREAKLSQSVSAQNQFTYFFTVKLVVKKTAAIIPVSVATSAAFLLPSFSF